MSDVVYTITNEDGRSGASVTFPDGITHVVSSDQESFEAVIALLLSDERDDNELYDLLAPFDRMFLSYCKLSERVSRKGYRLYFDGDIVNSSLAKFIVDKIDTAGVDDPEAWEPYIRFMEKLATNPSAMSQEHLFHFMFANNISIFDDGDLLFYKGVSLEGLSSNAGFAIVDGVNYGAVNSDSTRVTDAQRIPNLLGSTVEIPRSMVSTDRNVGCATGLHVANWSFACGFGSKINMVRVNPRDVVSVPQDSGNQKVRVSRYTTIATDIHDAFEGDIVTVELLEDLRQRAEAAARAAIVREAEKAKKKKKKKKKKKAKKRAAQDSGSEVDITNYINGGGDLYTMYNTDAESHTPREPDLKNLKALGTYPDSGSDWSTPIDRDKVEKFKVLITEFLIPAQENLSRYKNKRVTAARRRDFQAALDELDLN